MNILINVLGISDSGGVTVLKKLFDELNKNYEYTYFVVCNKNVGIKKIIKNYEKCKNFKFWELAHQSPFYRIFFENISFQKIINKYDIDLIYNFSGTQQIFISTPQLVKVHNLLFFSKKLDIAYRSRNRFFLWIKQVFLRRIVLKFMLKVSSHVEIQSAHVRDCLADFIDTKGKMFYLKNDVDIGSDAFCVPKAYDFSYPIKFLFIVGPHFEYVHKNVRDFTNAMRGLSNRGVEFEINITLTKKQLAEADCWDSSLDNKTNFLGYLDSEKEKKQLFCDNTILVSTSIVETLGLHVIEAIKNGVITIAPDEPYAAAVYGEEMFYYELFNEESLINVIMDIIDCNSFSDKILSIQNELMLNESLKHQNILKVFDEVINVQR